MGNEIKPYWHEASEEEIQALDGKATWEDVVEKYEQPSWCTYYKALGGRMGCWSLTTLEIRPKICPEFCKDCDCFNTASPASHEHK